MILGMLVKESGGPEPSIRHVEPVMYKGDYTNQMLVQIGSQTFTVTVDDAIEEATRD